MDAAKLIKRCKKNDRKAQNLLYETYKGRLMGICMRYAQDREEAEDMFQEAFVKVFKSIDQLKDAQALTGWVCSIGVRTAINYYHKVVKHRYHDDSADVQVGNEDDIGILDSLTNEQIVKAIEGLPVGYRQVFNLYVIDGYSHKEISQMLEITEGTSKSQLSRAKGLLKQSLEQIGIRRYEKV